MHNVHAYLLQLIYLFIYLFMAPAWWSLNSILCTDGLVMRFTQVCCIFYYFVSSSDIVVEIHSAAAKHVQAI